MPRRTELEDDWEEDDFPADSGDEDDEDTVPCPYCRRPIHEESERCSHCGNYISEEDAPPGQRPWWVVVGVLVCLLIILMWILG